MTEEILCLDTTLLVKYLVVEESIEENEAATQVVTRGLRGSRIVAPAFAWAEVGSALRKKIRQQLVEAVEAEALWAQFSRLPIEYVDTSDLRSRAWQLAAQYDLPTLYDAAFLACTETVGAEPGAIREFWTADQSLLRSLSLSRPAYVRLLRV